jgi:hypothetical protein
MDTNVAVQLVLEEEIKRQRRTPGEVSRTAGIGKNTLAKVGRGAKLTVQTLWAVSDALRVPMTEIAFRVDQRRAGRVASGVVEDGAP